MDVWSRDPNVDPNERRKRSSYGRLKQKAAGSQSGRLREISVFPLTKLIMDVPGFSGVGVEE
jgi:hypothetical protein